MQTYTQTHLTPLDRFSRSIEALEAFNHMLAATLEQGDDIAFVAGGIHHLLRSQCAELSGLYETFYSQTVKKPSSDPLVQAIGEEYKATRNRFLAEQLLKNRFPRSIAPALGMDEEELNAILADIPLTYVQAVAAEGKPSAETEFVAVPRLEIDATEEAEPEAVKRVRRQLEGTEKPKRSDDEKEKVA